jgi:hypothetical protein
MSRNEFFSGCNSRSRSIFGHCGALRGAENRRGIPKLELATQLFVFLVLILLFHMNMINFVVIEKIMLSLSGVMPS